MTRTPPPIRTSSKVVDLNSWRGRATTNGLSPKAAQQRVAATIARLPIIPGTDPTRHQVAIVGRKKDHPTAVIQKSTEDLLGQIAAAIRLSEQTDMPNPKITFAIDSSLLMPRRVKDFEYALKKYIERIKAHSTEQDNQEGPEDVIHVARTLVRGEDPSDATARTLLLEFSKGEYAIMVASFAIAEADTGNCITPIAKRAAICEFPFRLT